MENLDQSCVAAREGWFLDEAGDLWKKGVQKRGEQATRMTRCQVVQPGAGLALGHLGMAMNSLVQLVELRSRVRCLVWRCSMQVVQPFENRQNIVDRTG